MKKLFMFLAVSGLATFGASCSKSDDGGGEVTPPVANELKLSANPSGEVFEGTNVTFSVISGKEMIKDAVITDQNNDVVKDGKWVAKEGTFKFKATKKDYKDSNEVTIVVKKKVMKTLVLSLVSDPAKVTEDTGFEVKVVDDKNNPVDGAELYAGGQATGYVTENGVISGVMAGKGTYKLTVVLDESVSNEITVIVNAGVDIVGVGSYTFDGKTYDSEIGASIYFGIDYSDDSKTTVVAYWGQVVEDKDGNYAMVHYQTPTTKEGEGYRIEFPSQSNIMDATATIYDKENQVIAKMADNKYLAPTTYKLTNRALRYYTGDFEAKGGSINGKPFMAKYSGNHYYLDYSQRGAKGFNIKQFKSNKVKAVFKSKIVTL